MQSCESIYNPQEDSVMLEKWVRQYARGKVLDIGTGSGIQAIAAAQNKNVRSVLATDIQKEVINYCNRNIKNRQIKFIQSDLFQKIKGKFDTIIFNPPYLPQELKLKDLTLDGGKKGYEIIQKFIDKVNKFLSKDGIIFIIFSSLTRKEKVEEFIKNNLLDFEELEKTHIFFEDIYVYLLKKSEFLKRLEGKNIRNVKYITKGHRGLLFLGICKGIKVVIKAKNPQSRAVGRIENEIRCLRLLNKNKIGPKLLFAANDYFAYEYISGSFIAEFMQKSNESSIKRIIKNIFYQLRILDKLGINKGEMHHPLKHVIVSKNEAHLIDFERAHYSQNPKNVSQFCQFLMHSAVFELLKSKSILIDKPKLINLARIYKNNQNEQNFIKIIELI